MGCVGSRPGHVGPAPQSSPSPAQQQPSAPPSTPPPLLPAQSLSSPPSGTAATAAARTSTASGPMLAVAPVPGDLPLSPSGRKMTMKHTPKVDTEPLVRLQAMILDMGARGRLELTSIVAREGSGEAPGTLTTAQIPSLRQIPGMIFTLVALTELNLRCNQIAHAPRELGALQNLECLNLSENQLTELPAEITTLCRLRELEVAENYLTTLPEGLGQLAQLEILRANRNKLTAVPEGIRGCQRLRVLNLYNNAIVALGEGLGELAALDEVTLSNNAITSLPRLDKWKAVRFLYLQVNQLTTLPPLRDLTQLELLQAHQNVLKDFPELDNLPRIKKIDVNNNHIREIPDSLLHLPQLAHLSVRKNRVIRIPAFLGLCRGLEILDFGNNPIATPVPPELGALSGLKTLLLDGTKVSALPIELMGLQNLIRLHVGGCLRTDDQETAEVLLELKTRCQKNGGWLKSG